MEIFLFDGTNFIFVEVHLRETKGLLKRDWLRFFAMLACLYTKIQALFKKHDNFQYVFIYKNPDTLRYAIFHKLF